MIKQFEPSINRESLKKDICDYLDTEGFLTEFAHTKKFEEEICNFLGTKYCFAVNNGTISLSLALLANGIRPGQYVAVPNITMIATANAVKLIGAIPVFVEIDFRNGCLFIPEVESLIQEGKISAIIYVTLNGRSHSKEEIDYLYSLCHRNGVKVIEDNAQSFGSMRDDNKYISCPDIGIGSFSFSMPKIITTGQGGCLVTNNDFLAHNIRKLKDFGRTSGGNDVHDEFGINSKFTEFQAITGLNQLSDIDWRIQRKKQIYDLYYNELDCKSRMSMIARPEYHTPWFVDVNLESREELIEYLNKHDIQTRRVYSPISTQQAYSVWNSVRFSVSSYFGSTGLWLPSSLHITDCEIKLVCERIKEFYGTNHV